MDSNGNLYFVLVNPLALVCWDSSTPYSIENIKMIYQNDATLQFASGLKIAKNLNGLEELWVITNRFQVCGDDLYGQGIDYCGGTFVKPENFLQVIDLIKMKKKFLKAKASLKLFSMLVLGSSKF